MDYCFENQITVKKGYWRVNNGTDQIYQCIRVKSCLGGQGNFNCSQGYIGALCG